VAMTNAVNSLAIHNSVHHDPPSQSGTFRPPAYAETLRQQQPERHTKWAAKAKPVQQLLSVKAEPSPVPEHNAGAQQEVPVDSEIIVAESQPVTVAKILRVVAEHYRVSVVDIHSDRREACVVRPLRVTYYLAVKLTGLSLPAIGRIMGGATIPQCCTALAR
jgi:hypothetical protein